jgi:hypothetical protein
MVATVSSSAIRFLLPGLRLMGVAAPPRVARQGRDNQGGIGVYARATTHRDSPGPVEEAIAHYEEGVPALREVAGNRGAFLLVDRSARKAIGVTLWESEEAMRRADELRQQPVPAGDVDEYEVAVWAVS